MPEQFPEIQLIEGSAKLPANRLLAGAFNDDSNSSQRQTEPRTDAAGQIKQAEAIAIGFDNPGSGNSNFNYPGLESFERGNSFTRLEGNAEPAPPADRAPTARSADGDAPAAAVAKDTLTLRYGDKDFKEQLKKAAESGKLQTLKIDALPPGVKISSWLDDNGFFFWFIDGNKNPQHFHIPAGLKSIQVNGTAQDVDNMRVQAAKAYALSKDPNKSCDRAIDGTETVFTYGKRMSGMADKVLETEISHLKAAAKESNNPYLHLTLANFLCAQAARPILANFNPRANSADIKDPRVTEALDLAQKATQNAAALARKDRNFFAQDQAERLDFMIGAMKQMIKQAPKLELPPIGNRP